ncbi:MAG: aldo/keto reductase [Muribaculaceae bacterium]|nr:aldo/keto reductase [Muribaculaceae bacterium]
MKYVKLGNTGVDVSRICLGMMSFGKPGSENGVFPWARDFEDAKPIFKKAVDLGINYFDTANVYQLGTSEEFTGRLFREFGLDRDDIVVATKVNMEMRPGRPNGGGLSRKEIMSEIDKSLKRLQMDYVDLYQIHRIDPGTPMEEIMEALHDVVKSGKARYIGASTMYAWQFEMLQNIAERNGWTKFVTMQNQYNLMYREEEREMIPYCEYTKVGIIPWSPLAGGRLTHPWGTVTERNKIDDVSPMVWDRSLKQDMPIIENLQKMAAERGVSMAQEALAWMLSKPYITAPIVGTTSPKHVEEAVAALDIVLTPDEIKALEAPYTPHAVADNNGYLVF